METKICKQCGQHKPATVEFFRLVNSRHGNGKTYLAGRCIDCSNAQARERMRARLKTPEGRQKSRERARMRTKEQRQAERARRRNKAGKAYTQDWHAQVKERASPKSTIYLKLGRAFERHMDRLAEWNAREAFHWWIKHKASDETVQAFYADRPWANPRLSRCEQWRTRYAIDPDFNTQERIRRQIKKAAQRDGIAETIRSAIRRSGNSPFVQRELGYTIAELRLHIERQFHNGMSWQAFLAGKIHIDHIKPKASFDLSVHSEWVECWSLSNLRPLWATDNLAKSDNQTHLI